MHWTPLSLFLIRHHLLIFLMWGRLETKEGFSPEEQICRPSLTLQNWSQLSPFCVFGINLVGEWQLRDIFQMTVHTTVGRGCQESCMCLQTEGARMDGKTKLQEKKDDKRSRNLELCENLYFPLLAWTFFGRFLEEEASCHVCYMFV